MTPPQIRLRSRRALSSPELRQITGAYLLAMHRNTIGSGLTPPFSIWGFVNPSGSGKIVYLRRLRFETTVTTAYTLVTAFTALTQLILFRASGISGGVAQNGEIEKKNTGFPASVVNVLTRESSAQTAIGATLSQALRRGLTNIAWGHQLELFQALPDPEINDTFVLLEGEGLILQQAGAVNTGGYFATLEWEEANP